MDWRYRCAAPAQHDDGCGVRGRGRAGPRARTRHVGVCAAAAARGRRAGDGVSPPGFRDRWRRLPSRAAAGLSLCWKKLTAARSFCPGFFEQLDHADIVDMIRDGHLSSADISHFQYSRGAFSASAFREMRRPWEPA